MTATRLIRWGGGIGGQGVDKTCCKLGVCVVLQCGENKNILFVFEAPLDIALLTLLTQYVCVVVLKGDQEESRHFEGPLNESPPV